MLYILPVIIIFSVVNKKTETDQDQSSLRIVVADDHALVRGGLVMMLDIASPDALIFEANSLTQVTQILGENPQIDLLLLDLLMPGMDGERGIRTIRESWPDIPIIIVSVNEDLQSIRQSMSAGAAGYIPKTSTPNVTVSAIKLVLDGGIYIPPHVLHLNDTSETDSTELNESVRDETLTRRQLQVMELIETGKSNNAIAEQLGLSTGTVKMHVSGIFKKLNATSRTEAVALYSRIRNKS